MRRGEPKAIWEDQASLNADYLQTAWRAFDGGAHEIEPDGFDVATHVSDVRTVHDAEQQTFGISYQIKGQAKRISATVRLEHWPEPLGGTRAIFIAPCCGKPRRKLALMRDGITCRVCGRLVNRSNRKCGVPALVYRARQIVALLGGEACGATDWHGPITRRPRGVPVKRYHQLAAEHDELVRKVAERLQPRIAYAERKSRFGAWSVMTRAGL